MARLPTGTVTFLFTDIEGSTRLVQHLGDARSEQIFADHRRLLRDAVEAAGGSVAEDQGESFLFVFQRARDAVLAAVTAQRTLAGHPWPEGAAVRVRMGLHTGEPVSTGETFVGVDVHRVARICQAGHGGQVLLSQTPRDLVEEDLPGGVSLRDLGEHRLRDLAKPQRLFQVVIRNLPTDFPPLRSLDVLPNNLPIQLTSFIGRERNIEEVKRLLSETRLLTLTGVGGVGKTRLALQIAARVLDELKNGVWLVELAAVADPALVPQTVASALGAREQPGRPIMATLVDFLRPKQLLLALDNAEHVIEACAQLADTLLRTCPDVRILATSREGLSIAGETLWRVPSLSLPDLQQLPPVGHLMEFEAIRLFVERAKAVLPGFKLTDQNALAVVRICRQLDGLPLAIELAAARVNLLSGEQIVARLDDRFRLLTGGGRTTVPRQQTLRAVIDWSHDLLSAKEKTLLRRLSVFAGGWALEAAEAVCSGNGVETGEALDLLTQLVDKSLVVVEMNDAGPRYRLLETLRQYGQDRLLESGEAADVRDRHREWYLVLAERAELELRGTQQLVWMQRLETEHDNFRAALEWVLGSKDAEVRLRLAVALWRFWMIRGYLSEGLGRLKLALNIGAEATASLRAKALYGAGVMLQDMGDLPKARALLGECLAVFRGLGEKWGIALVLDDLAEVDIHQGDYESARALLSECLERNRELGNKLGVADALHNLGWVDWFEGQYASARLLGDESLALYRECGSKRGISWALNSVGVVAVALGEYASARSLLEEGLTKHQELGDKLGTAQTLCDLGWVDWHEGQYASARRFYKKSLALSQQSGGRIVVCECLEGLAVTAARVPDGHRDAARLFAAAEVLRRRIGYRRSPAEQAAYDSTVSTLLAVLGKATLATAWAEGQAMTLEQAIEYALSEEVG